VSFGQNGKSNQISALPFLLVNVLREEIAAIDVKAEDVPEDVAIIS
jgi:hypothetical protein